MNKIWQLGAFLGRHLGPLLKTGLPLTGNVLKLLAKSVITSSRISSRCSYLIKKMFRSGNTTLIISNEEMNDIMKIFQSLEESDVLI